MEKLLSEIYKERGWKIRFIRFWGEGGNSAAQVYYYDERHNPGWKSILAGGDVERIEPFQQYDDLRVAEKGDEIRWEAALLRGEELVRIK